MDIRQATLTEPDINKLQPLAEIQPNLVRVFGSPGLLTHPVLTDTLAAVFPVARRIGATTAGEISSRGVEEESLVVTAIRFDRIATRIATTELTGMQDSRPAGKRLAITSGDSESLRYAAHSLKSSSASVGAMTLSVLFRQLEELGRHSRMGEAGAVYDKAWQEYQRGTNEIRTLLEEDA